MKKDQNERTYDQTLDFKFIEKVGSPFDCDFPILGTDRKVAPIVNKKILVIRLAPCAELYARNNSVTYITDSKEKYDWFLNVVNHEKYGSDDNAILFNDWKNIDKLMENKKFDIVIGNPPYSGSGNPLYLRIAEIMSKHSSNIVWLCPTQWTYALKHNKYYTHYKSVLTCESYENIANPFDNVAIANSVGIYVFSNVRYVNLDELAYDKFQNRALAKSIWQKNLNYIKTHKSLNDFNCVDFHKEFYVHNTGIRGHFHECGAPCWDWTTLFGAKAYTDFTKVTCKYDGSQLNWNFDTVAECKNFMKCYDTDVMMFMLYCVKINNSNHRGEMKYIPWFDNYTNKLSEQHICNVLQLTNEELDYVHEEMKNFGWKCYNKKEDSVFEN